MATGLPPTTHKGEYYMSDANAAAFRLVREVTPGVTPTNPAFQDLVYVSNTISPNVSTETDDSISSDRQVIELSTVGYDASGEFAMRWRYGAIDEYLAAALGGNWVKTSETAYSAVAANALTVTAGSAFLNGHLVRLTGSALNIGQIRRVTTGGTATNVPVSGTALTAETAVGQAKVIGIEGVVGTISALANPPRIQSVTPLASAINFTTLGVQAGTWLKVSELNGFATAGCNGLVRVQSVTTTSDATNTTSTITLDSQPLGWVADAGAARAIRLLMSDSVRNGLVRSSYTIEKMVVQDNGVPLYRYFRGQELDFSIDIQSRSLIEVSFSSMGRECTQYSATRIAGATTLSVVDGPIYDASSNVARLRVGSTDFMTTVPSVSIESTNNMRGREGVGVAWNDSIGQGQFNTTGTLEAFFGDGALVNAVLNNSAFSLAIPVIALNKSSGYIVDMPRIKFTSGADEISGRDTDIIPSLDYQAIRHPSLGFTQSISRFGYLE
jgi:hypothetical protein